MGLTAVGSNPLTTRLYRSAAGKSCSQRRPKFRVRLLRTRQSSFTNSARYRDRTVLCEFVSRLPLLGSPRRNAAMSCPKGDDAVLTAGLFIQVEVLVEVLLQQKVKVPAGFPKVNALHRYSRPSAPALMV